MQSILTPCRYRCFPVMFKFLFQFSMWNFYITAILKQFWNALKGMVGRDPKVGNYQLSIGRSNVRAVGLRLEGIHIHYAFGIVSTVIVRVHLFYREALYWSTMLPSISRYSIIANFKISKIYLLNKLTKEKYDSSSLLN